MSTQNTLPDEDLHEDATATKPAEPVSNVITGFDFGAGFNYQRPENTAFDPGSDFEESNEVVFGTMLKQNPAANDGVATPQSEQSPPTLAAADLNSINIDLAPLSINPALAPEAIAAADKTAKPSLESVADEAKPSSRYENNDPHNLHSLLEGVPAGITFELDGVRSFQQIRSGNDFLIKTMDASGRVVATESTEDFVKSVYKHGDESAQLLIDQIARQVMNYKAQLAARNSPQQFNPQNESEYNHHQQSQPISSAPPNAIIDVAQGITTALIETPFKVAGGMVAGISNGMSAIANAMRNRRNSAVNAKDLEVPNDQEFVDELVDAQHTAGLQKKEELAQNQVAQPPVEPAAANAAPAEASANINHGFEASKHATAYSDAVKELFDTPAGQEHKAFLKRIDDNYPAAAAKAVRDKLPMDQKVIVDRMAEENPDAYEKLVQASEKYQHHAALAQEELEKEAEKDPEAAEKMEKLQHINNQVKDTNQSLPKHGSLHIVRESMETFATQLAEKLRQALLALAQAIKNMFTKDNTNTAQKKAEPTVAPAP
jgi:hypothetical protein